MAVASWAHRGASGSAYEGTAGLTTSTVASWALPVSACLLCHHRRAPRPHPRPHRPRTSLQSRWANGPAPHQPCVGRRGRLPSAPPPLWPPPPRWPMPPPRPPFAPTMRVRRSTRRRSCLEASPPPACVSAWSSPTAPSSATPRRHCRSASALASRPAAPCSARTL